MLPRGDTTLLDTARDREQEQTMEEEDNQDQEFSILKKSVIPNLLQDDFKSYTDNETLEPTFLTEVCDDEVSSELHDEEKAQNTANSMDKQEKRKCFEKDYDFRKTLINEESFETMSDVEQERPVHSSSTEDVAKTSNLNSHVLDIFAAIGLAMVIIELALYIL